jgi:putative hydrolase of the HAD superfamily
LGQAEAVMHRRYEAVFFDMGSTLVRPVQPVPPVEAWALALARLGHAVTPAMLAAAHERAVQEMAPALQPLPPGRPEEADAHFAVWSDVYRRTLQGTGVTGDLERAVAALWEVWLAGIWELYPEVPEVLQALAAQGYRLGIISNWTSTLAETCRRLGLARYCTVIVSSASAGYAKPHPRIFEIALDRAGVDPERAIHVGDRYETDVIGARAAGMDAVLLKRVPWQEQCGNDLSRPAPDPASAERPQLLEPYHPTIRSLTELLDLLKPARRAG